VIWIFETGSHYVAQADLEPEILLLGSCPPFNHCFDGSHVLLSRKQSFPSECSITQLLRKAVWHFLKKIKTAIIVCPSNATWAIYPNKLKQDLKEVFALPYSLAALSQDPKRGSKSPVYHWISGKRKGGICVALVRFSCNRIP
jgi:hypothetical protein